MDGSSHCTVVSALIHHGFQRSDCTRTKCKVAKQQAENHFFSVHDSMHRKIRNDHALFFLYIFFSF